MKRVVSLCCALPFHPVALCSGFLLLTAVLTGATGVTSLAQRLTLAGSNPPVLSLPSGVYAGTQSVAMTDAVNGAAIYYSIDGTAPSASSNLYTGPVSVASSETIQAVAVAAGTTSAPAEGIYTIYAGGAANAKSVIDFSRGFPSDTSSFGFNGSAKLNGSRLQLTDGAQFEAGNVFYEGGDVESTLPFITNFTFQLSSPNPGVPLSEIADGITFVMITDYKQNFLNWLGGDGSSLGYGNYPDPTFALKFDLHNDIGEGNNSTGVCVDNDSPTFCSINLNGSGIDLHSGHPIFAQITYDQINLTLTLTDTVTLATWSHTFAEYIAENFLNTPIHFGFTGGDGSTLRGAGDSQLDGGFRKRSASSANRNSQLSQLSRWVHSWRHDHYRQRLGKQQCASVDRREDE